MILHDGVHVLLVYVKMKIIQCLFYEKKLETVLMQAIKAPKRDKHCGFCRGRERTQTRASRNRKEIGPWLLISRFF